MADKKASSSSKKSAAKTSTVKATSSVKALASVKALGKTINSMPIVGAVVAEFLGTFIITASFLEMQGNPLFFAFALVGAVLVVGGVSGAHLNPAMTIGAWATKKISSVNALFYILAQVLGAVVAWLVLNAFLQNSGMSTTTSSLFHAATITGGKEWYVFFAELLATTIFAVGVATAIRLRRNKVNAAFVAGFAVLTALYIGMSITTTLLTQSGTNLTFLNPAIAAVANGLSWNMWPIAIFVLAPVLGGIIGFAIQDYLYSQSEGASCDCDGCSCDCCK